MAFTSLKQFRLETGMKIIVDADACPVKEIIEGMARHNRIKVIMVSNYSHEIRSDYAETVVVDKEAEAADITIVNMTEPGDIIITQDYGLASIVLAKGARALNPNGKVYTDQNIDMLLTQRYLNAKARRARGRHINLPKRSTKDNLNFEQSFQRLLDKND